MNISIKETAKIIKDNWIFVTVAFLSANIISIASYYGNYGLNVLPYLEISELVTTWFVQITLPLLLSIGISFFVMYLLLDVRQYAFQQHYNYLILRLLYFVAYYFFFKRYVKNGSKISIEQFNFIRSSFSINLILALGFLILPIVAGCFIPGVINIYRFFRYGENKKLPYYDIICIWIVAMLGALTIPTLELQASDLNSGTKLTLYTKSDTISTSSTYKYIGRTKNYIFFYDKVVKKTSTYSLAEMIKITQE